ncbi:hypothetical protein [Streptomyces viridochromogenes]|jgi:hypothetical protein|uniref:hypothetical protein n=1 Tax=Streptomyces viridochromogenes TaxID=1938 RepID=UPI000B1715D8|nr:hypothetical protein [Streptomyces viridochromogenes]
MAGWTCAGCTTTYSVGAPRCPNCGSTERTEGRGGAVLPSLTVECGNGACPHVGKRRRVHLRTAAPGVLEMPRLVCAGCGLDMPTVTPWPPVTGSEEDTMPKITVHGGPSYAADIPAEPETDEAAEGSEEPSAGSSSETSSPKSDSTPETSETGTRKPARKTASRSKKATTGSSTAPSTDGDQETSGSAADTEDASS